MYERAATDQSIYTYGHMQHWCNNVRSRNWSHVALIRRLAAGGSLSPHEQTLPLACHLVSLAPWLFKQVTYSTRKSELHTLAGGIFCRFFKKIC